MPEHSDGNGALDAIAFIHSRITKTKYTVKSASGRAPLAVVGDSDWVIHRAYTSLVNAERGTTNGNITVSFDTWTDGRDLVVNNEFWNLACYGDAEDADFVIVQGWTTSASNRLRIFTPHMPSEVGVSQRHDGKWSATAYTLSHTNASAGILQIKEDYVIIDGLQINNPYTGAMGNRYCINLDTFSKTSYTEISNSILRGNNGTAESGLVASGDHEIGNIVINCIAYNFAGFAYSIGNGASGNTGYGPPSGIYNSVAANSGTCFDGVADYKIRAIAKNNIAIGCTTDWKDYFNTSSEYNATDLGNAPGTNAITLPNSTLTNYFVSTSDFHINPNAANAGELIDKGVEVETISYKDIDDVTRTATWDLGADEHTVTKIYRSVGASNTSILADNSDSGFLKITGDNALFTLDLPNNNGEIGVGDVLYYDSNADNVRDAIAFIHERKNSKTFTIKGADGLNPTETDQDDTDWRIYRAYTGLDNAVEGIENASVGVNFDTWTVGKDITFAAGSNEQWNIACYGDGADVDDVVIRGVAAGGWGTSSVNYLKIYSPYQSSEVALTQRHSGSFDNTKYILDVPAVSFGINIITAQAHYIWIDGIQIDSRDSDRAAIEFQEPGATGETRYSNNIIWGNGGAWASGIYMRTSGTFYVWNNISYDWTSGTAGAAYCISGGMAYFYNNTAINSTYGIRNSNGETPVVTNNLAQGATVSFEGSFHSSSNYNLTDTGAATGGANDITSSTLTFIDAPGDDFHLSATDIDAIGAGTNLGELYIFDIDGEDRNSAWDIGADQR